MSREADAPSHLLLRLLFLLLRLCFRRNLLLGIGKIIDRGAMALNFNSVPDPGNRRPENVFDILDIYGELDIGVPFIVPAIVGKVVV